MATKSTASSTKSGGGSSVNGGLSQDNGKINIFTIRSDLLSLVKGIGKHRADALCAARREKHFTLEVAYQILKTTFTRKRVNDTFSFVKQDLTSLFSDTTPDPGSIQRWMDHSESEFLSSGKINVSGQK